MGAVSFLGEKFVGLRIPCEYPLLARGASRKLGVSADKSILIDRLLANTSATLKSPPAV